MRDTTNRGTVATENRTVEPRPAPTRPAYRWWLGWRPLVVVTTGMFLGFSLGKALAVPAELLTGEPLAAWAVVSTLGFLAGVGAWRWGAVGINETYEAVLDELLAETRPAAVAADGASDPTVYTLTAETGSRPLVAPKKEYVVTHVVCGETLVAAETTFDMVARRRTGQRTVDLPWAAVSAVETTAEGLIIATDGGERYAFATDRSPDEVAAALRAAGGGT